MVGKKASDRYTNWAEAALDLAKAGRLTLSQKSIADSDKFEALRKVPVLKRLNDAEIWELVHAGSWSRVPARTAIVKEGDEGKSLFFLGSGHVKIMKGGRLLNMLNAGECFGEMAYIKEGGMVRQATVEAGDDALVAEFNPDMLGKTSINCRLQLTTALLHMMVDRLAVANQRIAAQK
jgi:CRP-like cAMP-binding protein